MKNLPAWVIVLLAPALCSAQQAQVPAFIVEIPASVSDVLIAETASATLHRFGRTASGILDIDRRYMSIGQNGAGKVRAWDRKTPLGIYFITEELDTSGLDTKYGVAAYPLDYPNAWDRYRERTGDGIWLHGVDRNGGRRPPRDTDGCLALPNDDLLSLADSLEPLVTPVIVARKLRWTTREEIEELRTELRIMLEVWRQSLEDGDLPIFLSLYADEFRYGGVDKESWASRTVTAFEGGEPRPVRLEDILLIADPEEDGLYLSRFTQEFATEQGRVRITRRLYWQRRAGGPLRIIAESVG